MDTFMVNGYKMTADEVRAKFYDVFTPNENLDSDEYIKAFAAIEAWAMVEDVKGMAKALRWHFKHHSHDFEQMRREYKE